MVFVQCVLSTCFSHTFLITRRKSCKKVVNIYHIFIKLIINLGATRVSIVVWRLLIPCVLCSLKRATCHHQYCYPLKYTYQLMTISKIYLMQIYSSNSSFPTFCIWLKRQKDIVKGQQFWEYNKKPPYVQLLIHWGFCAFFMCIKKSLWNLSGLKYCINK